MYSYEDRCRAVARHQAGYARRFDHSSARPPGRRAPLRTGIASTSNTLTCPAANFDHQGDRLRWNLRNMHPCSANDHHRGSRRSRSLDYTARIARRNTRGHSRSAGGGALRCYFGSASVEALPHFDAGLNVFQSLHRNDRPAPGSTNAQFTTLV